MSKDEPRVDYSMTRSDLEAAASKSSDVAPNVTFFGKTAFTIENAPIPKSVREAIGAEKTITIQMKVKLDKPG